MSQTLTYTIGADKRALVSDVQDFHIDFTSDNSNWVQARQYEDSMRQVFVNVKNQDGTPYNLTGANIWFEGILPDKTHKILDAEHAVILDATNGQFRFDMPKQAFAVAGSYQQAFFRIVRDGASVTTLEFDLEVLADKVISNLVARDYVTPFEDLYDQLDQILSNANNDLQNKLADWQNQFSALIQKLNDMGSTTTTMLTTLQAQITAQEEKITQSGLFTQSEADAFEKSITDSVNQQIEGFKSSIDNEFDTITKNSSDELLDPIYPIPSYLKDNFNSILSVDKEDFSVGFITDLHYQYNDFDYAYHSLRHINWFGNAMSRLGVDAVITGGDNINGDNVDWASGKYQKAELIDQYKNEVDVLEGSVNDGIDIYQLVGNHDAGYNFMSGKQNADNSLSDDEMAELIKSNRSRFGEARQDGNSFYFYRDYSEPKIRLIGLDTCDWTMDVDSDGNYTGRDVNLLLIRQKQLDWLANQALILPSNDWQVLIFFHVPITNAYGSNTKLINSDVLIGILKAFKAGTNVVLSNSSNYPVNVSANFASQGAGTVIAIFNGHLHTDAQDNTTIPGITMVEQTSDLVGTFTNLRDSVGESAWSVITINKSKRQVTAHRFGKGQTITFNY